MVRCAVGERFDAVTSHARRFVKQCHFLSSSRSAQPPNWSYCDTPALMINGTTSSDTSANSIPAGAECALDGKYHGRVLSAMPQMPMIWVICCSNSKRTCFTIFHATRPFAESPEKKPLFAIAFAGLSNMDVTHICRCPYFERSN